MFTLDHNHSVLHIHVQYYMYMYMYITFSAVSSVGLRNRLSLLSPKPKSFPASNTELQKMKTKSGNKIQYCLKHRKFDNFLL